MSFVLTDDATGAEIHDAVATLTILRKTEGAGTLLQFKVIPHNPTTGRYELDVSTSGLEPGLCDFYIGTSDGQSYVVTVEVTAP